MLASFPHPFSPRPGQFSLFCIIISKGKCVCVGGEVLFNKSSTFVSRGCRPWSSAYSAFPSQTGLQISVVMSQ